MLENFAAAADTIIVMSFQLLHMWIYNCIYRSFPVEILTYWTLDTELVLHIDTI